MNFKYELIPGIRNTVRAIIIRHEKILLLKKSDDGHTFHYALPGGAQDQGETLVEALQRECLEEINTTVTIERLLYIADFFKEKKTTPPTIRQQLEIHFLCYVAQDYVPQAGHHPDKHQLSVQWIELNKLPQLTIQPAELYELLNNNLHTSHTNYMGLIK